MHRGRRVRERAIRRAGSWALRAAVFCAASSATMGEGNMSDLHQRLMSEEGVGGGHRHVVNDVSGDSRPESAARSSPRAPRPAFRVKRVDERQERRESPTSEKLGTVAATHCRASSPSSSSQTNTMAQATDLKASLGRWSKRLGTLPSLALPTDYPRTSELPAGPKLLRYLGS